MYLHDLSPFAIKVTETFGIRWYGLACLAGFLAAYFIIKFWSNRGRVPLTGQQVGDYVFCIAIGTIVGGRLGYCLFYDPQLFLRFTSSFPFWGALEINRGGMASHGGIIGIILSCFYFARSRKLPVKLLFDLVAITGCLGIFFGRVANFVTGELYGRPTQVEWAVQFPQEMYQWADEDPSRLLQLGNTVRLAGVDENRWKSIAAATPHSPLVYGTIDKIIANVQAGELQTKNELKKLITPRHASQLYEAFLEGLLLFILFFIIFSTTSKYGICAAAFLILYPIVRIIGEQFRMPDPQIGFQLWGLTRGQWLSLVMLIFGIISSVTLIGSKDKSVKADFTAK